jgi:hypothetical protein
VRNNISFATVKITTFVLFILGCAHFAKKYSINRPSTRSQRGFSRRAKTRTRSRRVVWSSRYLGTRSRQGFSRQVKARTRARQVVWSPRLTALRGTLFRFHSLEAI